MKPLMLIPPAQAEALFDAWHEQAEDRFGAIPWLDDDSTEDSVPLAITARRSPNEGDRLQQGSRKRAA